MLTEKEAAGRWCPFAARTTTSGRPPEPGMAMPPNLNCIGSRCMAWRWNPPEPIRGDHPTISTADQAAPATTGYCGLARKP